MTTRRQLLGYTSASVTAALTQQITRGTGQPRSNQTTMRTAATEYFADPNIEHGLKLMPIEPSEVPRTTLPFGATNPSPRWQLNEWYTRHSIANSSYDCFPAGTVPDLLSPAYGYQSEGKRVLRLSEGTLWLEALAGNEYTNPRQENEEWPHLLIEQRLMFDGPRLSDLCSATFNQRVQLPRVINRMSSSDYNPDIHAAQVTAYFSLQNLTEGSPDFGSYVWFGVPYFDNRYDMPSGHFAQDVGHSGQTNQFIATYPADHFWQRPLGDGDWHTINTDLLPLMRDSFILAQERGYLPNTRWEDLILSTFNLGWELPGTFDAVLHVSPPSLMLT